MEVSVVVTEAVAVVDLEVAVEVVAVSLLKVLLSKLLRLVKSLILVKEKSSQCAQTKVCHS